jgi:hypothetical protein
MCAIDVCIPKMEAGVSENNIRTGIENTKIGKVVRYTEIPWKYDTENKRVLMNIEWNREHAQYDQLKNRLEKGDNIKIVIDTLIWHIYKKDRETKTVWARGVNI